MRISNVTKTTPLLFIKTIKQQIVIFFSDDHVRLFFFPKISFRQSWSKNADSFLWFWVILFLCQLEFFIESDTPFDVRNNFSWVQALPHQINWQTISQTRYLPMTSLLEKKCLTNHESLLSHSIEEIESFSHFWTIEYKKPWYWYKNQSFLGCQYQKKYRYWRVFRSRLTPVDDGLRCSRNHVSMTETSKESLDLFPQKVQSYQLRKKRRTKFLLYTNKLKRKKKSFRRIQFPFSQTAFFTTKKINQKIYLLNLLKKKKRLSTMTRTNTFFKVQKLNDSLHSLNKRLKILFYQYAYWTPYWDPFLLITKTNIPNDFQDQYRSVSSHWILSLLNPRDVEFVQKQVIQGFPQKRMSGFLYPDRTVQAELSGFFAVHCQKAFTPFYKTQQIFFGQHFTFPVSNQRIWPKHPKALKGNLDFYKCLKKIVGKKRSRRFYVGPVISKRQILGTTVQIPKLKNWRVFFRNYQSIFFDAYLRQMNHLNFFSRYGSLRQGLDLWDFQTQEKISFLKMRQVQNSRFLTKEYYQNRKARKSYIIPISKMRRSRGVRFDALFPLNKQQWQQWAQIYRNQAKKNTIRKCRSRYLPFRKIVLLFNFTKPLNSFDILDYQGSNYDGLVRTQPIKNRYILAESFIKRKIPQKSIEVIKKKRYLDVFPKWEDPFFQWVDSFEDFKKQTNSSEISESFTKKSWLIVYQLLFLFVGFSLLRYFYVTYGRELLASLLDLLALFCMIDTESMKVLLLPEHIRYTICYQSNLRFKDLSGMDKIGIPFMDLLWDFRSVLREKTMELSFLKGFLLVGPPGTGKTIFVKAFAGEAGIPCITHSPGSFHHIQRSDTLQLKELFEKARELAPCLLFFDEIDTICFYRPDTIIKPHLEQTYLDIIHSLANKDVSPAFCSLFPKRSQQFQKSNPEAKINFDEIQNSTNNHALLIFLQLLVEIDGLQAQQKVVIVGSTNRPQTLDPALVRPGRLSMILNFCLPSPKKQIQLFQFHLEKLGYDPLIDFQQIDRSIQHLSPATIAAISNESTISAVIHETKHDLFTLNKGFTRILGFPESYSFESIKNPHAKNFLVQRRLLCQSIYWNIGITLSTLFSQEDSTSFTCFLFEKQKNFHTQPKSHLLFFKEFQKQSRKQVQAHILQDYAGYFAQQLFFPKRNNFSNTLRLGNLFMTTKELYELITPLALYTSHSSWTQQELLFDFTPTSKADPDFRQLQLDQKRFKNQHFFWHDAHKQPWFIKVWWQKETQQQWNPPLLLANHLLLKTMDLLNLKVAFSLLDWDQSHKLWYLTRTFKSVEFFWLNRDRFFQLFMRTMIHKVSGRFIPHLVFSDHCAILLLQKRTLIPTELKLLQNHFYRDCNPLEKRNTGNFVSVTILWIQKQSQFYNIVEFEICQNTKSPIYTSEIQKRRGKILRSFAPMFIV